jgi:hypothetical protein
MQATPHSGELSKGRGGTDMYEDEHLPKKLPGLEAPQDQLQCAQESEISLELA